MKKVLFGTFLMLGISANTFANDWNSACDSLSGMSGLIMENRQKGIDKKDFIQYLKKQSAENTFENRIILQYAKDMMDIAYKVPKATSTEAIAQTVTTFKADMHKLCVNNMNDLFKVK